MHNTSQLPGKSLGVRGSHWILSPATEAPDLHFIVITLVGRLLNWYLRAVIVSWLLYLVGENHVQLTWALVPQAAGLVSGYPGAVNLYVIQLLRQEVTQWT
jgi:uncharacterized membrane protein